MSNYNFTELENVMANWAADHGLDPTVMGIEPEPNNVVFIAAGTEMLKVAEDGFYIRGQKVPVDDQEAETVYNALKEFLVWSRLQRE
jgi:hypothetical protein